MITSKDLQLLRINPKGIEQNFSDMDNDDID